MIAELPVFITKIDNMKQITSQPRHSRLVAICRSIGLPAIACLLSYSGSAQLPNVVNPISLSEGGKYLHVKGYSTEMIPFTTNEAVMAGTIYDIRPTAIGTNTPPPPPHPPIYSRVHFLRIDANGNVAASKYHKDPDFFEERAVDIAAVDPTHYLITSSIRRTDNNNGQQDEGDKIRVIEVDQDGNHLSSSIISLPVGPNGDYSLHPIHTLYYDNALYICGFTATPSTLIPNWPGYGTYDDKKAFVIKYSPSQGVVLRANVYDWLYIASPFPANRPKHDYDIAMRLVPMSNGNVFVTGSCNAWGGVPSMPGYSSGTMCMEINKNSLYVEREQPFTAPGGDLGVYEYGVGMVEKGDNLYVIGNNFTHNYTDAGTTSAEFDMTPRNLWVTRVEMLPTDFSVVTTGNIPDRTQLYSINNAWALQTLPAVDPNPTILTDPKPFVIAGLQTNDDCNGATNIPTVNNINPFLNELEIGWDVTTGITRTHKQWTYYRNQTGTTGYPEMGWGLSNIGWNPTFAARASDIDEIHMSAPKWDPTNNVLNLKYINAFASTHLTECNSETQPCAPGFYTQKVTNGELGTTHTLKLWYYPFDVQLFLNTSFDENLITFGNDPCTPGNSYKPSGINDANQILSQLVTLYPNPATNSITLANATGKFVITDVTGRKQLEGDLAGNASIDISSFANGMYLISIVDEKGISQTLKFTKE
jgi:hypothetical protein